MKILRNQRLEDLRVAWDRTTLKLRIVGKFWNEEILDKKICGDILLPLENWAAIHDFNSGAQVIEVVYSQLIINDDNKVGIKGAIKIYYQTTYNGCEFINEIIVGRNEITATKLYIPKHNLTINLKTGKVKQGTWKSIL